MKIRVITAIFLFISICLFASPSKIALVVNLPTDLNVTNNKHQRDFAIQDTEALKNVLANYRDYDVIVIDDFTQVKNLTKILEEIACNTSINSLFFYYGGYGFNVDNKLYLSVDTYDSHFRNAISYDLLVSYLKQISENAKVFSFFNYNEVQQDNVNTNNFSINVKKNILSVMASNNTIQVYENYEKQHSAFAFFLTEAMRGQADLNEDSNLSFDEILQYLSHNYQSYMARYNNDNNKKSTIVTTQRYLSSNYYNKNEKFSSITTQLNAEFNEVFDNEFKKEKKSSKKNDLLAVDQIQFFNTKNLSICSEFAQKTTTYIGFDVLFHLLYLPDPSSKITVSIYMYYPDGSLMGKLDKLCRPIASVQGGMFCRATYGWDEGGHWPFGKYTVKVAYKDTVLKTAYFYIK